MLQLQLYEFIIFIVIDYTTINFGILSTRLLIEDGKDKTIISGAIEGLKPGKYTLRIHRSGDIGDNCKRAGAVFSVRKRIFK